MEVSEVVFACSELHSLLVSELNHIEVTLIKETMMPSIAELINETFQLVSQATNTEIKRRFP